MLGNAINIHICVESGGSGGIKIVCGSCNGVSNCISKDVAHDECINDRNEGEQNWTSS